MSRQWRTWAGWLALTLPIAASAQVDLTTLDEGMVGPRAQVLVLGTAHLSGMPEGFDPDTLDPVLDRLAKFAPDVITIEALSGEECDLAARHAHAYGSGYCPATDAAKAATGLDVPAAIAKVNETLKTWPAKPTPAQRRHLAALFLAANARASAYVQWLHLPANERHTGDGLDEALVDVLRKAQTRNDESYQIGARLAVRLGLQRLHAVDDHTGDNLRIDDFDAFGKALQQAWDAGGAAFEPVKKRQEALMQGTDMLALYRFTNSVEVAQALAEVNVTGAMASPSPQRYPQIWVAGWETRNLRMVANIREAFRERPGARVLSIVGASHKPWFDEWLGQLQGVDIVDAQKVLE